LIAGVVGGMAAQEPGQFSGSPAELVVLSVVVGDRQGREVDNLSRERFTVYDDDHRQPIALFSNQDEPVSVALVVDISGSMRPKLAEVVVAALA